MITVKEYCIIESEDHHYKYTWCGKALLPGSYWFDNIHYAIREMGRNKNRLNPCSKCLDRVVEFIEERGVR